MSTDRSLILLLTEPDSDTKRVVKVAFVPFVVGTQDDADVRIEKSDRPMRLRIIRRDGRYRILKDIDDADSEATRGAWLHNGIQMHFGGVFFRFFTHAPPQGVLDARNAQIEVVTSPTGRHGEVERVWKPARRRRARVKPYVPQSLDLPTRAHSKAVPCVASTVDPVAHIARLEEISAQIAQARTLGSQNPPSAL
jgi:hypothetical protein